MELEERDELLATLAERLAEARAGRGSLVLVMGEAGIGKSALVRRFSADHAGDARVLWGVCEALRTPRPLGPLRDIARTAGGELARLVAADAPRHAVFTAMLDLLAGAPAPAPGHAGGRPSEARGGALAEARGGRPAEARGGRSARGDQPALVVIEDVHWADDATLDLLLFLGRRLAETEGVVVVTFRDDEIGRDHPLRVVLGDLATARAVHRLTIPPLSPAAVARLAEPHHLDADQLYATTNGNPFFVSEVLAEPDRAVPGTVRDAVLARVARLSPAARDLLDAAAMVPDRVELPLLWATAEPDQDRTALDECGQAGILSTDGRTVRFRHELARVAVERAAPEAQRVRLHARVLDWLTGQPDTDPARLAYHAEEAGDGPAVLAHAPAAAERAAGVGAHRAAAAHYARALRFADHLPPAERAELWETLAAEYAWTGEIPEALDASTRALELWRATGDRERIGTSLGRRSSYLWNAGQLVEARAAAQAAIDTLGGLPPGPGIAAAYASVAMLRMLARDFDGALSAGRTAIGLAETYHELETLARALNSVGSVQWFVDPEAAGATLDRSLAVARESGNDPVFAAGLTNYGSGAGEVRRYAVADPWLRKAIAFAKERDLDTYRLYCLAWLARTHFEQGLWAVATDLATEALGVRPGGRLPAEIRVPMAARVGLTVLGRLRVRRGDPDPGSLLDWAWELARQTGDLQRLWPVAAARAEAAWLAGRPDEIESLVADSYALAVKVGHTWAIGELAYWRWRVGTLTEPPAGAAPPYAMQIEGQPRRAATAWLELGCPYEAAIALAETDEPEDLMTALAELSDLGAWPAVEQVSRRLRELGLRRLPRRPRRSTLDNPARLTAREVEVLTLLPAGLRNVDIAARLHISPKTVDHHISAILSKLGVGSRREAAQWASRVENGEPPGPR